MVITSGFLVVKTFERMYREYSRYVESHRPKRPGRDDRSVAQREIPHETMPRQYCGIQRDPIDVWHECLRGEVNEPEEQELAASLLMGDLLNLGKQKDGFILALEDAEKLLALIKPPLEREIIWAGRTDVADAIPPDTAFLGYDPTAFYPGGDGSAIASWMFFPLDPSLGEEQMQVIAIYCDRLNEWGLFDTPHDAQEYLDKYQRAGGGHPGVPYYIAQIRAVDTSRAHRDNGR